MAALHQQQQQRSRMLGLMQSTAAQTAVNQPQYPPAAAPRMTLQAGTGSAARNLFSSPTESSATNSDNFFYPRQPVLMDEFLNVFLQFVNAFMTLACSSSTGGNRKTFVVHCLQLELGRQ